MREKGLPCPSQGPGFSPGNASIQGRLLVLRHCGRAQLLGRGCSALLPSRAGKVGVCPLLFLSL